MREQDIRVAALLRAETSSLARLHSLRGEIIAQRDELNAIIQTIDKATMTARTEAAPAAGHAAMTPEQRTATARQIVRLGRIARTGRGDHETKNRLGAL